MTINISEDDTKLFQDNGFSYDDVSNTVNHYREIGLNDDEIQNKINKRIEQFKSAAPIETQTQQAEKPQFYISEYKRKNPIEKAKEAFTWTINSTSAAWNEGRDMTKTADLEMKDMLNTLSAKEKRELDYIDNKNPYPYNIYDPSTNYHQGYSNTNTLVLARDKAVHFAKKSYIESVKMLPLMWETLKRGGAAGAVGAAGGAVVGAARSALTTKADIVPSTVQGATTGAIWASRIAGGVSMGEFEAGLARHELKEENKKIIAEGGEPLSTAELNALSLAVGAVNGTLEFVSFRQLMKTVPGGDKIIQQLEKKELKNIARDKTVREQLTKIFSQYGKSLATETSTEMLQETSNIVADYYARKIGGIEDDSLTDELKKNSQRIIDTGVAAFGATMYLGGFGTTAKTATILTKQGMDKNAAEKAAQNMTAEQKRQLISENMDTLMQTVDDIPSVQEFEKTENIKNILKEQVSSAVDDDLYSDAAVDIFTDALTKLSKDAEVSLDRLEEIASSIKVKTLSEEEAINQYNSDITLNGRIEENVASNQDAAEIAGANENEIEDAQKEWKEKGTESKYFKNWFRDSKVTDEEGKPLIVYHGTNADFEKFEIGDIGYHFGNLEQANERMTDFVDGNPHIMPVYLKMENPLDIVSDVGDWLDVDTVKEYLHEYEILTDEEFKNVNTLSQITSLLKNKGYDGVIYENQFEGKGKSYIVFDSSQIKSVDNRGTFDAENPNIFFQPTINPEDDINQRTDKTRYLTDNEVKQLEKDKENFNTYIGKLIKGELKPETQIRVLQKLPSAYNKISNLKGKKLVINQEIYKKIIDLPNIYDKNHYIDRKRALKLPEFLSDPLYILQSTSEGNEHRYIVVANTKGKNPGEKLSVFIEPKNNAVVVSAYDEKIDISKEKKAGRVLYDKKKELSKTTIASKARTIDNSNNIITNSGNKLNPTVKEHEDNKNFHAQPAYHGTPHRFEAFSTDNIGSGEGVQAHGWGLYFAENKDVSDKYRAKLVNRSMRGFNEYTFSIDGEPIDEDLNFFLSNNLSGGVLYNAANTENPESQKELIDSIKWHIDYLRRGDASTVRLIKMLQEAIDKIENNPEISITKFLDEVPNDEKSRFKTLLNVAKREAKEEGKKANIQYLLKWIKEQQKPFVEERNKELARLEKLEKLDIDNIKISRRTGQLFEVDIPENDVLLDEDKPFSEQSKKVQEALKKLSKQYSKDNQHLAKAIKENLTGKDLYYTLTQCESVDYYEKNNAFQFNGEFKERASKKLNELGVKGITYDGRQDGRCYVVFEDKAVNIIKKYYQTIDNEDYNEDNTNEQIKNARGFTYQTKNFDGTVKDNIIVLLKNKADKSTLMHEFAHIYLDTLVMLAKESDKAKDMLLTVNKWLRYDGVEYTTAQHEKFAKGFEAYIKTGKAPTFKLKRAFEAFRKWLGDIYNSISVNGDLELDDETKKVFDSLLGDTSVDVQQKLSWEIINNARNFANLKISKITDSGIIHPNVLTDKQIRYRETAYDIIFYALKHSKNEETRNYVKDINQLRMILGSNSTKENAKGLYRQFERIELLLAETDDAFSAHDGFLPEWQEFFHDPGVSYDNQVQGADAELALQALDVIRNKKYLVEDEYNFDDLTKEEEQRTEYELDYILEQYKYAKNDSEKTNIISAFYDWIGSVHPYIEEDMINTWEQKTNEIDRYEALDKWQKAKEDLSVIAATMKHQGDYSSQFADYARQIIKRLDFMNEPDKAKLFDKLKDFNSFRDIERNLDDIMDFAQTLYDVSERRHLAEDIEREVKRTIHEWQNGIKKTKYTYPANKLFERLRAINNMNREEIEYLYDSTVNEELQPTYEADAVHDEDYYSTIEKMFIEFKYNGSYYNSTDFLTDLLNRIQSAKFTAKLARDEIDFERRMQQINLIDECAKSVDTHKNKVSKLEQIYRHGFNLNSALEMIFNKAIKEKFSLDYLYALKDGRVGQDRENVLNRLAEIWGYTGKFKNEQLFNRFINMTKKEFEIKQRYTPDKVNGTYRITHTDKETGKTFTDRTLNLKNDMIRSEWEAEPIKLSRMEVLYYYIQAKNPISYKMLTDMGDETTPAKGQFDEKEFNDLLNNLTPKEKLMGDILQIAAEKYYDELNRYHIKKYHTELGKAEHYFPRKSEMQEVKPLELFNDYVQFNANQKFQKQRTAGPGVRIAPANPLAVLFDHMEKANTLIIMGEKLDLMNRVFKDSDLQRKLKAVWGDETTSEFMKQVTANLYSGQQSVISEAESSIGGIMNNVIKAQIFFKPQVGLKQLISFMNYGVGDDYVSPSEWLKAFAKQTFTPSEWKKNIDYMLSIPYLKDRFTRGGSTDALKRQLEQRAFAKISLLDEKLSANVRYGDIGAIILGGKPYIDCLKNKGYSEDEAIKIFIEKTVNDQQSSIPSTLSNIQRSGGKHPLGKMFFAYQNTPWQYFRTAMNAIIRAKQNPEKKQVLNALKLTGIYLYLFPLLFNMASSLSPLMAAGGDDDELKNDFAKSLIGGFTFIPIAGQLINAISTGFRGERASTGNWFDTASAKIGNVARKTKKGDVTALDIFYAASLFGEASTGVPIVTIGTEASGLYDITQGDVLKGSAKLAGYSDYRGKKLQGEK